MSATFEAVNKQIEKAPISKAMAKSKADAEKKLKAIWNGGLKGVLSLLVMTPFIPKKWKEHINTGIQLIDVIVAPAPLPEQ